MKIVSNCIDCFGTINIQIHGTNKCKNASADTEFKFI